MAASNIPDFHSQTQGLIEYLLNDASQISLSNISLCELGNAVTLKRKLLGLLEDWVRSEAKRMIAEMVEAYKHRHPQPTKLAELRILPARPANVERSGLPPFFRNRETASAIRRSQRVPEQKQWATYFEAWGCLICQRRDVPHASNGMCHNCRMRTYGRLKRLREPVLLAPANVMRLARKKDPTLIA
jgi:hypothetical protein